MSNCNDEGLFHTVLGSNNHTIPGITRRDWLAGLAMQGLLSNPEIMNLEIALTVAEGKRDNSMLEQCAYKVADRMIAQSRVKP